MTSEPILDFISERIKNNGYNSVNFDLALTKEDRLWKILFSRIIFDVSEYSKPITFLKDDNFVIERVSISINQFREFFNYLMRLGARTSPGLSNLTDDLLYTIGDYKLCFLGNFLPNRYDFHGRERAKRLYGIDKPVYRIEYSLQNSVISHSYQSIDVSGHKEPFTSVFDAVNYYWHTQWEQYNLSSLNCGLYLPIFDASIKNVKFDGMKKISVELDFPTNSNIINELSVGINTNSDGQKFIERFPVVENLVNITVPFTPTYAILFLHKNKEKLDEYYYNSPPMIDATNRISDTRTGERYGRHQSIVETEKEESSLVKSMDEFNKKLDELSNLIEGKFVRLEALISHVLEKENLTQDSFDKIMEMLKEYGRKKGLYHDKN